MSLTQVEADHFLRAPKLFVDSVPIEFNRSQHMNYDRLLRSSNPREEFILTIERGRRRMRLKYQTRARRAIILARLDINARRHRNPEDAPYKGGEWISETHLHIYREGYDDKIAFELDDAPGWTHGGASDDILALENFMRFCGVENWPPIQTGL